MTDCGEINGERQPFEKSDGQYSDYPERVFNVSTHGYIDEFEADHNELNVNTGRNRLHLQCWFDNHETIHFDSCGSRCPSGDVYPQSSQVTFKVDPQSGVNDSDVKFDAFEPDETDIQDGTGYSVSLGVSVGGVLSSALGVGISLKGNDGNSVDKDDYNTTTWKIDIVDDSWPDSQENAEGVKWDIIDTGASAGSTYTTYNYSQLEYRYVRPGMSSYTYEKTPEVEFNTGINAVDSN